MTKLDISFLVKFVNDTSARVLHAFYIQPIMHLRKISCLSLPSAGSLYRGETHYRLYPGGFPLLGYIAGGG